MDFLDSPLKEALHESWSVSFDSFNNNLNYQNTIHIATFTPKFLISVFYWHANDDTIIGLL